MPGWGLRGGAADVAALSGSFSDKCARKRSGRYEREEKVKAEEGEAGAGAGCASGQKRFLAARSSQRQTTFRHDCLRQCSLFAKRDPRFLDRIMDELTVELYQRGDIIMSEGEEGDTTYVLHRGEVEVLVGPNMDAVATLSSGSVFGEMTLLGISNTRTCTIRALEFCDCRVIRHSVFTQILRTFPHEQAFFKEMAEKRKHEAERRKPQVQLEREHRSITGGSRGSTGVFRRQQLQRESSAENQLPQGQIKVYDSDSFDPSLCPFFSGRNPVFLQQLTAFFHVETFVADDIILLEGDVGDTMYFLHRGEVEILVGAEQTLVASLSSGAIFGEMSLLGINHERMSTVRATDDCDCRVISHKDFKSIVQHFPEEAKFFMELAESRKGKLELLNKKTGKDPQPLQQLQPLQPLHIETQDHGEDAPGTRPSTHGAHSLPSLPIGRGRVAKGQRGTQVLIDTLLSPRAPGSPKVSLRTTGTWTATRHSPRWHGGSKRSSELTASLLKQHAGSRQSLEEECQQGSYDEQERLAWRRPCPELPPRIELSEVMGRTWPAAWDWGEIPPGEAEVEAPAAPAAPPMPSTPNCSLLMAACQAAEARRDSSRMASTMGASPRLSSHARRADPWPSVGHGQQSGGHPYARASTRA